MLGKVISFYISLIQQTSQNIKVMICIKSMFYATLLILITAKILSNKWYKFGIKSLAYWKYALERKVSALFKKECSCLIKWAYFILKKPKIYLGKDSLSFWSNYEIALPRRELPFWNKPSIRQESKAVSKFQQTAYRPAITTWCA